MMMIIIIIIVIIVIIIIMMMMIIVILVLHCKIIINIYCNYHYNQSLISQLYSSVVVFLNRS